MKKIFLIPVLGLLSLAATAQQFAHVDFQQIWMLCPEADQARVTMRASSKEAQETYQSMMDEFQTKYKTYQEKASTWTAAIRESKEKELTEIQQRIQEFGQSVEAELQQQETTLFAPIMQKSKEVVAQIGKEKGVVYVFIENTVLYIDKSQSIDITAEARKRMGIPEDRTLESLQQEIAELGQTSLAQ